MPPRVSRRLLRTSSWAVSRWCIVAMFAGLLSASCGAAPAVNTGPLGDGGQPGVLCNPVHSRTQSLTNGFTALSNSSKSPVVINHISLDSPHRLRLLAAYVVPIAGHNLVGDWAGFPPSARELSAGVEWAQRRPAVGAHIAPDRPNQVVNLVVALKPEGLLGTAKGIDIYYSGGITQYHMLTATQLRVVVSPPEHC
jgi:hypothetical protein